MWYKHWKAKPMWFKKYWTRKSWNNIKNNIILPRADWSLWYQTEDTRSKRRKYLEKLSNKKIRNSSDIWNWNAYRKHFNLRRELD